MARRFSLQTRRIFPAFTLIELLVVVAIIAILISILLPSLNSARNSAKAVQCGANLKDVGVGIATFVSERGFYPPSYAYPDSPGDWDITLDNLRSNQSLSREHAYQHWSYYLYSKGTVHDKSFTCPSMNKGGHPRTYPGMDAEDWEAGQSADGNDKPFNKTDRQARRIAYTANAAILPRNKFSTDLADGGPRVNVLVRDNLIKMPGRVVLATEFNKNWRAVAIRYAGGLESRSHRPVTPFYHTSSTINEYAASLEQEGFRYNRTGDKAYGLVARRDHEELEALIDHEQTLNAVGRHHPGGDQLGGTANFLYCDGHVQRKTIKQTIEDREWGENYYSITGNNRVVDRFVKLP